MDPILTTIDEALKRKGLSDAAASKLAVGHPSLIKNFRIERSGEKRYNLPALQKLAQVLDLDFYFGPRREFGSSPAEIEIADASYSIVPRASAEAGAGPGAVNDQAEMIGGMAFRSDWLRQRGINPGRALLMSVRGESMSPTLLDRDAVLVNLNATEISSGQVYALNDVDGETRVKRLVRPDPDTLILQSDNSAYSPELRRGIDLNRLKVLGRIEWSARSWA